METLITVYTLFGFNEKDERRFKSKCDDFTRNMQPTLKDIVDNNKQYKVSVTSTSAGRGLVNGHAPIPEGVKLAYFPCTVSSITAFNQGRDLDRRYTFHHKFLSKECVYNGKTQCKRSPKPYNLSVSNHKCKHRKHEPSCRAEWMRDAGTGLELLVLISDRVIQPGEELCWDYNNGKREGYFQSVKSLLADDVPERVIAYCQCANEGGRPRKDACPLKRGYDRRVMEQSMGCRRVAGKKRRRGD